MSRVRPLLIFDSGVGGLSVLDAIRALLPTAPIVYAADSAGFPYGTRSAQELEARVPALLGRLAERYDPELVVIACNTASTIALDPVRAALDLPVVGTVPAIKPAAALTRTGVIGVLGTPATVVQPYVDRLTEEFARGITVVRHGSADLVRLAEDKLRGQHAPGSAYAEVLAGLLEQPGGDRMDTVVLACTHFPLVEQELGAATPRPLTFVNGKEGIARRTAHLTRHIRWPASGPEHLAVFTGRDTDVERYRPGFAAYGIHQLQRL